MNVFIENQSGSGSSFEIEVDPWDKVLDIKEKIDKSQRIPVSKQTLFFQGTVLQDDLDVEHYVIDDDSRLQLFISPDHNPNHNVIQTQKSLLPSSNDELLNNQEDLPAEVGRSDKDDQVLQGDESLLPSSIDDFLSYQEYFPVKVGSSDNDNQVLEGDKSPLPSIDELFDLEDSSLRVGSSDNDNQVLQDDKSPLLSINEFFDLEDSSLRVGSSDNDNQVLPGDKSPLPLSIDDFLSNQEDSPVKVGSSDNDNQVLQGDKSPLPSINEFFDLQDSSLRVGSSDNSPVFQNEQAPVPSDSVGDNINDEDLPLTIEHVSNIRSLPITPEEIIKNQDSQMILGSNNNKVFQTQQSPLSDRMKHILNNEYSRLMNSLQTKQSPSLDSNKETINIPEEIINNQDSQMIMGSNNNTVFQTQQSPFPSLQTEQSPSLDSTKETINIPEEIINNQDSQMIQGSNNDTVFQTQQPPQSDRMNHIINKEYSRVMNWLQTEQSPSLDSTKETINIPDSHVKKQRKPNPRKLRVMVLPFSSESKAEREIPVKVDENDNVNELRKVLVEMQSMTQLNLPEEGYFFKHKQRVLNDDQSFRSQGVANGDQIEISTKHDTHDSSTEK